MSSPYFDLGSELFRRVFRNALTYPEYLATGNGRERAAWALVRGLRAVGSDRGPARRGGGAAR